VKVQAGDEYDGIVLEQRLVRYADELRSQGYYEARVSHVARFLDGGAAVGLTLTVDAGPRVEIVFEGDPLPGADRDRLVPVAREHSVDEDILEDSKFGVERYFRDRGYCSPRADYQRAEQGAALRITFTIVRGSQCTVEHATLLGNTSIPAAELAPLMLTKSGQPFNESTVGGDVARIQSLYRQRGFASAMVTSQVDRGQARGGVVPVTVTLRVSEGVRSVVQSVALRGNIAIDTETLRRSITTAVGQAYFDPQIAADTDALSLLYLNRGYQEVAVRPEATATGDGAAVDLLFNVQEGPRILIDHVLIVGNERTNRETILRAVQLKSGQPLSQQQEDETRTRLAGLGLFRRVDISYLQLPGERLRRDVVITVEEAPVTTIGYGGGLEGGKRLVRAPDTAEAIEDFQFAPRGFFEVSRRNLFGGDRFVNFFARVSFRPGGLNEVVIGPDGAIDSGDYGFNEYLFRATYGERRVFGTESDLTLSGGIEQGVRSSFDFNRRGGSAIFTRRVTRTVAVSARYGLDNTELLNIKSDLASQPEIDRLFPQVRLSSVSFSLVRDTRNDSFEPSAGSLLGSDTELAARKLGSQVGFLKTFVQAFAFRRLPGSTGTVTALGARVGLASGFPREVVVAGQPATVVDDLPASERFYAGGDTTVRGFALDRLGTPETIDPNGFPKGGHGLIVLNGELRIPVRRVFTAVVFLDAGNVYSTVGQMSLAELRASAGVGFRYRSRLGRFDWTSA
jgi:outer membrane protein insertion porin family